MPSFEINPKAKKGSERDKKLQNRADAGGVEGRTAAKMLQKKGKGPSLPGRTQDMKKVSEEEVVPGIKLVDIILGEEKCGKGMYYCYTDKKCKKLPEGLKMTARFGGGGHDPEEVGIDKPVEGGNGGNGGGTTESVSIEDAFGNKFMEVVDLIKPEDIVEKCWKGYTQKGMKKKGNKVVPNCVPAEEVEHVDEAVRLQAEYGNLLAVVVMWRGRSLMIKMFFPQASMPKREDVQREIEKVYPGGKVTHFHRTDLPSEYSPHNAPIVRVQKEEACPKCAGKCGKGCECDCHKVDEEAGEKDACYHKVKARYSVWPSAYASGALVKCRKKGAKNWGNKTKKEEFEYELNEGWVANTAAKAFVEEGLNEEGVAILIEEMGLESFVEFVYDLGESTMLSEARAGGVRVEPVTKGGKAVGSLKGGQKASAIKRLRKEKQARRDAESGSSKPSGMKAALRSQSDRARAVKSAKSQQPKKRGLLDKVAKTVLDGMDRHNKAMKKAKGDIETTKKAAKKAGKVARDFGSGFVSGVKTAGKAAKAVHKLATEEEDRLGKSDLDEATPRPKATQRGKISKAEAQKRQARADRRAAAQERRDDRAKAGIDALIGSDEDRKAAAAARANPQGQRQKALKRTIADRMAKGAKDNNLGEKLNLKKADMGEVIDDFYDSDAPQFKGKSKEKRRQMAIAAKLQAEDWQKVNRKDKTDGLSQKAVNAYRKENPGSKLKTAVTTKPSKLKKGSKDAKRRSSFCSRMKGMKKRLTSAKTARDPDSRINKALRRWNCN